MSETILLFKCLADTTRLEVIRALADGPKYVELLSQRLERSPSTISFHLKKLEEAGLVDCHKEQYYAMYSLRQGVLDRKLSEMVGACAPQDAQAIREQEYRDKVLKNHFEYDRLKTIPVQRKKRRIILEKLAESFERGRKYPEREINLILAQYHDDFCTLRREMIAEGLMEREHGEYWLK